LIVSGINKGGNLGDDITYSGTVSAAFEGPSWHPSFAISWSAGAILSSIGRPICCKGGQMYFEERASEDTLLNVNVPNLDEREIKSYQITQQGRWIHSGSAVVEKTDPEERNTTGSGGAAHL